MADAQAQGQGQAQPLAEAELASFQQVLQETEQRAIEITSAPDKARVAELLGAVKEQALQGTLVWNRNTTNTLKQTLAEIDAVISRQLAAVMHSEEFQKLEGSWRGLHHLVDKTETGDGLKIRVLSASKKDLQKDFTRAVEFDQSSIFKRVYENEFGMPGGEPYGALIGDYEFTKHPEDIELVAKMSEVAAAAFCPFLTAASPSLFGFGDWTELGKPRDLEKTFTTPEYTTWRSFRERDEARFVTFAMPRVLARLPYGKNTKQVEEFDYEEVEVDKKGHAKTVAHKDYCWMNAAYVLGTTLTAAFAKYGWCTAIRGVEGGGKVEGLPVHVFKSDDGDIDAKCPTEIGITDRREAELSKLGFLPLCHFKNADYSVFFGAQTAQKPKKYDKPEATANAAISARLPYILATSRFAHFLKVMARDKIGSFLELSDCETWLNNWIMNYVNANPGAGQEMKARFPLADAKIEVKEVPGKPGSYNAVAWLRPWLQLEELTTRLSLVARIPKRGG